MRDFILKLALFLFLGNLGRVQVSSSIKGIEWGILYNTYGNNQYDPIELENKVSSMMIDDEVENKKGIYEYLFDGLEKHLNLRTFSEFQWNKAYNNQNGICPFCVAMNKPTKTKVWLIDEMEADHITP